MTTSIIDSALAWAAQGVPVFPCNMSKAPMTESGFYNASVDPDTIRSQFNREDVMIGGRMGKASGLFVLDFDLYKEGDAGASAQAYMEMLQQKGVLVNSQIHTTMSGGVHILYRSATEWPNCAPVEGVEVKGEGGYVILPDSHGYAVEQAGIAQAPDLLIQMLKEARRKAAEGTDSDFEMMIISGNSFHDPLARLSAKMMARGKTQMETMRYLLDLLDSSVARDPQHSRHSRWFKLKMDEGGELSRLITGANEKFNPQEKTRKAQASAEHGNFSEFAAASESIFGTPTHEGKTTTPKYEDTDWAFDGEGFDFFAEHKVLDQKEIVAGLLPEDELLMVNGHPKAGKSMLMYNLAMHVGAGIDISDRLRVPEARPVLYFALEGVRAIKLRSMAKQLYWKEHGVDYSGLMLFVIEKHKDFFDTASQADVIKQIVAADKQAMKKWGKPIGLVCIDTLTRAMPGGNQNDASDTGKFFNIVPQLRSQGMRSAYAVVHHLRKDGDTRGSTNIDAEADTITKVYADAETGLVTWHVDRARSIETGESYHFTAESVGLGTTQMGTNLSAPVAVPADPNTVAAKSTSSAVDAVKLNKTCTALVTLGAGRHDMGAVARALTAAKLIKPAAKMGAYDELAARMLLSAVIGDEPYRFKQYIIRLGRGKDQALNTVMVTHGGM